MSEIEEQVVKVEGDLSPEEVRREALELMSDAELWGEAQKLLTVKNKSAGRYKSAVHEKVRVDKVWHERNVVASREHDEYVEVLKVAQERFGSDDLFRANKALAAAVGAAV